MSHASVVVCTRDRLLLLRACLASLDQQSVDDLEVVVVDNGSTDGTAGLLASWEATAPGWQRRVVVAEPVPGLSRSRNAGTAAATGEVVLFLDDDALAPAGWVAAHLRAHRPPGVVGAGGPIVLAFPDGRPGWAGDRLAKWWSALDFGPEAAPWPTSHGPYGANMSVRRSSLLAVGGFDPELGRRGHRLLSGEEGDVFARLWAAGGAVVYEPAAVVVHQVGTDRLSERWVLRRGWAQGESNMRRRAGTGFRATVGEAADQLRRALRSPGRVRAAWRAGEQGRADLLDELATRAGHVNAALSVLRGHRRSW